METTSNLQELATAAERIIASHTPETSKADNDEQKLALLARFRRAIELYEAETEEQGETSTASKFRAQLNRLEERFRLDSANRAASAAQQHAANRLALLANAQGDYLGGTRRTPGADSHGSHLLAKSREANESLVRTRNIIVQQLSRVTEVGAVLNSDAEKLRDTDKELHDYANNLSTSGGMIRNLQQRERTDRMLMYLGFGFLVLVATFIVFKRVRHLISPLVWLVDKLWGAAAAVGEVSSASKDDL